MNPIENITLRPDRQVEIHLNSSISEFAFRNGKVDLMVIESSIAWAGPVGTVGIPKNNRLTLWTQDNLTARISLSQPAEPDGPGVLFLTEPIELPSTLHVNVSDTNVGKMNLIYTDVYGNLTGGHVQFLQMERSWCKIDFYNQFGNVTYFMSPSNVSVFVAVDMIENSSRYRVEFNNRRVVPTIYNETQIEIGGPLRSKVFAIPKPDPAWRVAYGPATQLMLYTTDSFGNIVYRVLRMPEGDEVKPTIRITADEGRVAEANYTEIGKCFVSVVRAEFESWENPCYNITYDFGPFGPHSFEGGLYDPEVTKMDVFETDYLIPQSPDIDREMRRKQTDYYESLYEEMVDLLGIPVDYKFGIISNILWAGFENEILHGCKLEFAHELFIAPDWPMGDYSFITHEIAHTIHKPPYKFGMIRNFGEAYATLLGYKAQACLFGDPRLFDFLMSRHDLFLRHQHGEPIETSDPDKTNANRIEIVQFITYYIDRNYGWNAHKRMILEWERAFQPLRDLLSANGFNDIEQMAIIYSHLVRENIAWLFDLGGFDVAENAVNAGIELIIQYEQQTGNLELKIGETQAITQTTSVPIMLRRAASNLTKINLTLCFDHNLIRASKVYTRDLTDIPGWNLTVHSSILGQLTIELQGVKVISGVGSIAQVNFELAHTEKNELPILIQNVSTNSEDIIIAEGGRIILGQMSITRPKNLSFEIFYDGQPYYITMYSNSTIKDFHVEPPAPMISFNVSAPIGTVGFCNITIPKSFMWCNEITEWIVKVDQLPPLLCSISENSTHTFLSFTYKHSSHEVKIESMYIIPEITFFPILPLFMIATLLAVIIYKRKRVLTVS